MYELCNPEFFFDKLHLTPPDKKLGRGGWRVDKDSRDNRGNRER